MLHGRLAFADLASPIEQIDGGLSFGRSAIFPVQHRLLRTDVIIGDGSVAIISYERFAGDPVGIRLLRDWTDAAIQAALDTLDDYALDFAALVIDRRRGRVAYRSSAIVSIPVYLIVDSDAVSIDWDYARLLDQRPTDIAWDLALAQIAGIATYGTRTVVEGLHRATAGATLTASRDGLDVSLPGAVLHDGPREIMPDAAIEPAFFAAVQSIIAARAIDPARTAVELSGGMDSALTAVAAAAIAGPGVMSIGAQFAGEMGVAQRARRELLRRHGGFDDLSVPAERFAPFSPASRRRIRYGVMPDDENYPEMFEAIFGMLRDAGIDTVISGLGGDELYVAYAGEEGAPVDDAGSHCPFLTADGLAIAAGARSRYPAGWLQETCWRGAAGQSQRVLRYGLWPIHPYHTPALARFVSRLPRRFRHDRALLRDTLGLEIGNDVFARDYVKETFRPVALHGIAANRDYLIDLVRRSVVAQHPEIDAAAIVTVLEGDIATLDRDTYNALFRALKLFCFFQ